MDGTQPNWNSIFVQGRDSWGAKSTLPMRLFNYTSPDYFHTMGSRAESIERSRLIPPYGVVE